MFISSTGSDHMNNKTSGEGDTRALIGSRRPAQDDWERERETGRSTGLVRESREL